MGRDSLMETDEFPARAEDGPCEKIESLERLVGDQEERLAGMLRIAANLTRWRDPRRAMKAIVKDLSELTGADRTTIYEVRREEQMLMGLAVQGSASLEVGIPLGHGIAGQVALRNRTINLKDAYRDPHFDPKYDKLTGYRTRSMLCVPMRNAKREVVGVVQVLNKKDGSYFNLEDEKLLQTLAGQAGVTLEALHLQLQLNINNAELLDLSEQLKQKVAELELLYDNEQNLGEAGSLDSIADTVLPAAARLAGAEAAALFLPGDDGWGPAWVRGAQAAAPREWLARMEVGDGILGLTAATGRGRRIVGDEFNTMSVNRALGGGSRLQVADVISVPLTDGDRVIGAFALCNFKAIESRDTQGDEQLAALIAGQFSRAVVRISQRRDAQLRDRLVTIGRMMSGVLHDLKGPMTIISGYSQLMAQAADPEKRVEMADSIRRQVEVFNDMAKEVLSFARGERQVLFRKVFVDRFVTTVTESLRPEFEERGIAFIVDNQCKKAGYFDEAKMLRVVTNIARNARQAMGTKGTFSWRMKHDVEDALVFELEDDGPGIPEVIRANLFDAFTTSGKAEGTGLGLAIVRRIVEDHGGSVAFTTETDVGTCFTIRLPGQNNENHPSLNIIEDGQ